LVHFRVFFGGGVTVYISFFSMATRR